jgi:hypothetical protein
VSSVSAQGRILPSDPQAPPPDPAALLPSTRSVRLLVLAALPSAHTARMVEP